MTEIPQPRNSSDIAKEIRELTELVKQVQESVKPMEEQVKDFQRTQETLRQEFDRITRVKSEVNSEINKLKLSINGFPERIKHLENEYRRINMQEEIALKLESQMEEFRAKCLAANWRGENRTDGKGAFPHQIEGAIQLAVAETGFLFDKRGLGKTLTSGIYLDLLDVPKAIVFAPNDVASQLAKELVKWFPHRQIVPFYQTSQKERELWLDMLLPMQEQWIVVMNYQAWRKDWSIVEKLNRLQPDAIIVDEAHNVNKTGTLQWKGINYIRTHPNKCPKCGENDIAYLEKDNKAVCQNTNCANFDYYNIKNFDPKFREWQSVTKALVMTGTPILNRPQEFYAIAKLVKPWEYTSEIDFVRKYCHNISGTSRWTWKYGAQETLMNRIGPALVMRDRKSAGVEIPEQEIQVYELEFDEKQYPGQAKALKQIKEYAQLVLDDAGEHVLSMNAFITLLLRLRQAIVWPAGISLSITDEEGNVTYKQNLNVFESIKMDWVTTKVSELVDEGERVVVFSHFKAPLIELGQRLSRADISNVRFDGDTSHGMRELIKRDFDPNTCGDDPRWQVFLGNYKAAGEGLNLHAATQMVPMDEEWSPGRADQAYGRIDRLGTTKQTGVHIPRVLGSIDMWMAKLLEEKADTAGAFDTAAKVASLRDALKRGDIF